MRRLPVLQTPPTEDAEAEGRGAWQWLIIAAAWVLASFLPLSMIAVWLAGKLQRALGSVSPLASAVAALPVLVAYALSAWGAGAAVGRFGVRATRWTAYQGGALGGALVFGIALLGNANTASSVLAVLLPALAAAFAGLGARWGRRRREPKL